MSDKKDDELAGFRDFLDGDKQLKKALSKKGRANNSGYELLSFLEKESQRIDKQLEVLEEKSYLLKSCDSFENINRDINKEIAKKHSEMTNLLFQKDSPMIKSLEELFESIF